MPKDKWAGLPLSTIMKIHPLSNLAMKAAEYNNWPASGLPAIAQS